MPLTNDEKHEKLGEVGEKIVRNWFAKQGAFIEDSVDPFNRKFDFKADGKTVEVKTQIPFVSQNAVTFVPKQMKKIMEADRVFFVIVPSAQAITPPSILEVDMKAVNIIDRHIKNGELKHLIKLDDPAIKVVHTITDEAELNLLTGYSTSDYRMAKS